MRGVDKPTIFHSSKGEKKKSATQIISPLLTLVGSTGFTLVSVTAETSGYATTEFAFVIMLSRTLIDFSCVLGLLDSQKP